MSTKEIIEAEANNKVVVPLGVNFENFYTTANKKGLKIKSRYKGVYCRLNTNKRLHWMAQIRVNGVAKQVYFPFTEDGERAAHEKYLELKRTIPIKPKTKRLTLKQRADKLAEIARGVVEYLNHETFVKGKPTHLNNIGAKSILHKKLETALTEYKSK
jgi:hypothetical protein